VIGTVKAAKKEGIRERGWHD